MSFKRFFAALVAVYVVGFLLGWFFHGFLLADDYRSIQHLMLPESQFNWGYMMLAYIAWSAGIPWLYRKGVENKPWIMQGIRFGLGITAVAVVPVYFGIAATQPWPGQLITKGLTVDLVTTVIVCIVVAYIYKDQAAATPESKAAAA